MAAFVALGVLAAFLLGYRLYGRYVGARVFQTDDQLLTPAHALRDDQDFVPTNRHVLLGHHFTSIAGAAPIIGPCVASYWGWLPALLWVVLGTIFMGAVHDFGALVVSVRERGSTIADVTARVVSGRARLMFLSFVMVLTWLVLAVFAMAIAGLFVSTPSSVLPINIEIVVALWIGWAIYKRGIGHLWPSLVALVILYLFVWVGVYVPLDFTDLGMSAAAARQTWIVLLLVYSAVASLLPVWLLLQPRDFINGHQLMVGLALLFAGLAIARPEFDAPLLRTGGDGAPPLFPMLFVTVACGAISGFHGLVSSGTTSKQLDSLGDARLIGYGAMLGEGALATAALLAAVAVIGLVGACELPGQGAVADLSWSVYYDSWSHAERNGAVAFVLGGGAFLEGLGLSPELARTLMAVLVISFAATTLDTATRIQRMIIVEWATALGIRPLTRPLPAVVVALIPAYLLTTATVTTAGGETRPAGLALWPIFGASNQMMAALTLMVMALYFWQRRRPVAALVFPMLFVMGITLVSLLVNMAEFLERGDALLLGLSVVLTSMILWMIVEGSLAFRRARAAGPAR